MTDQTQAAAAAADAQAKPGTEAESARDTLEAALAEFDEAAKSDTQPSKAEPEKLKLDAQKLTEVVSYIDEQRQKDQKVAFERDISDAVRTIKGDIQVDDDLAEGWLYAKAEKDQRFLRAFQNRGKNPAAWKAVLTGLSNDFAKKFEAMPDREATEDRNAARAAVRSAATARPETPAIDNRKLDQMSNAEFERYKRGLLAG